MADTELNIKISGDPKDAVKSLEEVEAKTESLSNQIKEVGKIAAVGFGAISAAIGFSVKAYGDQQKADASLQQSLIATKYAAGLSATELQNLAQQLASTTKFSDEAVVAAESLLLGFDKIGKKTFPDAIKAAADLAEKMGTDLTSATRLVGRALQDPAEGLSTLSRLGIRFTEDQQKVITALVESGRAAEAQGIILQSLATFSGGQAAAATKTLFGALTQLKNEFGEIGEGIGSVFTPILTDAVIVLKDLFVVLKDNRSLIEFSAVFLGLGATLTGTVAGVAGLFIGFQKLLGVLPLVNIALTGTTNTLRGLAGLTGIGLVLVALSYLISNWTEVQAATSASAFAILATVQSMATSIVEAFKLIGQSLLNFVKLDFAQADIEAQAGGAILRNSFRNAGEAGARAYAEGKQVGQALIDQKNAVLVSSEQKAAAEMEAVNAAAAQREYEIRTGSANDIQAIVDGKVITITDAESLLRDQVSDIYEDMGDFQVSDYESTTSELLDAAAARRQSLTETESGGSSGGGFSSTSRSSSGGNAGGGSAFGVLLDDSEAGRAARRNIPVGAYNPFTGRKDLREYVQNFMAESGIAFRQGFSGENFMARFSGKEIVIPENFSKGIKKGRFRLVGVNDRPNDLKGGSQSVKVSVGFNGPEAAKVLTANQRTESTLNLDRARRFLS